MRRIQMVPTLLVLAAFVLAERAPAAEPAEATEPAEAAAPTEPASPAPPAVPGVADKVERQARSRRHTEAGRRLLEDFYYVWAQEELSRALAFDPGNEEAAALMRQAKEVLQHRAQVIAEATRRLSREASVIAQEKYLELVNHYDAAQRNIRKAEAVSEATSDGASLSESVKHLNKALLHAERAREILKWMPYAVRTAEYTASVNDVRDRSLRGRKRREMRLLELAKEHSIIETAERRRREDQLRREKVYRLEDQAWYHYHRREYDRAEKLGRTILRLDPSNAGAHALIDTVARARLAAFEKKTAEAKEEATTSWRELSASKSVPWSELIVYPDDWDQISRRQSPAEERSIEADWKKDIRGKLERKVTFEFVNTPLDEALGFLQTMTAVPIIQDPAAFSGGRDPRQPITLKLTDTRLDEALRWILRLVDLDYTLKRRAIFISTREKVAGEAETRIYDVRDLTYPITDFPAGQVGLGAGGGGGGAGGGGPTGIVLPGGATPVTVLQPGGVADLIKKVVDPRSWVAPNDCSENNGQLIVHHRTEVHQLIAKLLEDLRKSQTLQVMVETRFLDVREGFLEEIGVDWAGPGNSTISSGMGGWTGTGDSFTGGHPRAGGDEAGLHADRLPSGWNWPEGTTDVLASSTAINRTTTTDLGSNYSASNDGLRFAFSFLGNVEASAILSAVRQDTKSEILFAPRLTMYNNQRAHVMVGTQQSYVSDFNASGDQLEPVISQYMDGVVMDVRPIVSHDRQYVTLELRPTVAQPVGSRTLDINGNDISRPEMEIRTIKTVVTVPDGGTVLLSGLMKEDRFKSHVGVPILGDLPVFGRLFSKDFQDKARRNLLILVKVQLILFDEIESKL